MVVQGKATIDEYDLEEEGLATLASAQIPALGPKWCLIPVHSNKCCGVWGLYLIFASLCSTSSNIEGLSVDHASEFVSLTDLAVKSPFSSSLKNVFTIYKKKKTWNCKSFNNNFNCTEAYYSLILFLQILTTLIMLHVYYIDDKLTSWN